MGLFLHALLFPGSAEKQCQQAVWRCAADRQTGLQPNECSWHTFAKGPAVLLNDGCLGHSVLEAISPLLACPALLLYIYDDDFWGYELAQAGKRLDEFASLSDYFEPGQPPAKPGNALALAACFKVEAAVLEPYLQPWVEARMGEFACPGDDFVIGDCWQLADFMRALGFEYDELCPPPEAALPEYGRQAAASDKAAQAVDDSPKAALPAIAYKQRPVDTPVLPDALTDAAYARQRAAALPAEYAEIVRLIEAGQYAEALPLLTEAIQANPKQAGLYLLRAFCWCQLENLKQGRNRRPDMDRDLSRALELEPDNIWALRARCPTTGTSKRYQRHVADLTRLLELDEANQDFYQVSRAYRWHWLGNDAAAKADLAAVLQRGKIWTVDLTYLCRELQMPGF